MEGCQGALCTEILSNILFLTVVYVTFRMCFDNGFYSLLQANGIVMLLVLSGASLFMVIILWLDEVVELSLYKEDDAGQYHIQRQWPARLCGVSQWK